MEQCLKKQKGGGGMIKDLNSQILEFLKNVEEILRKRELEDIFIKEFYVEPDEFRFVNDEKIAAVKIFENLDIAGRKVDLVLRVVEDKLVDSSDSSEDWKFVNLAVIFSFEKHIKKSNRVYRVEAIFRLSNY
jgi:hypothetical protein